MKTFNLKQKKCEAWGPVNCLAMTEDNNKFLIGGMDKGHLMIYNRAKGGVKTILDSSKKSANIVGITNMERMKGKYFCI